MSRQNNIQTLPFHILKELMGKLPAVIVRTLSQTAGRDYGYLSSRHTDRTLPRA